MRRDYDIFEKFTDGSTLWRACVSGRFEAQRKMQEMSENSDSQFYLIDVHAGALLPLVPERAMARPLTESGGKMPNVSKAADEDGDSKAAELENFLRRAEQYQRTLKSAKNALLCPRQTQCPTTLP